MKTCTRTEALDASQVFYIFTQTTMAYITIPLLQIKTLKPREVTQDQVVNKLAKLSKLGLGPRSACLQSRLGSESRLMQPHGEGLFEKPWQRTGSQSNGRSKDRHLPVAGFSFTLLTPSPSPYPYPVFDVKGCGLLLEYLSFHVPQECASV